MDIPRCPGRLNRAKTDRLRKRPIGMENLRRSRYLGHSQFSSLRRTLEMTGPAATNRVSFALGPILIREEIASTERTRP